MTMKTDVVRLANKSMTNGFMKTMSEEFANTDGKINMARIGAEAIGVLVLVVIWSLIPVIGSAITKGMPEVTDAGWNAAGNGTSLWATAEPLLRVCVIVLIAALILAVVFELRAGKKDS